MYTSWSLCSSRVRFRGVWLIVFGFRQRMVIFAMIHSSRVDRVRSRHLGRIRTRMQWQCHLPISLFWLLQQRGRRTESALFALTVSTFPRNANVVERATAAAVVPPTIVKNRDARVSLPRWKVTPFFLELQAYKSLQHHVFLRRRAFLLVWQRECFT